MNSISTQYRKQVTWNGYGADVMKSGLQKYIRRSMHQKALYCARELDLFKEAPNAKEGEGIRTNFLHRLMIIFMEDVENMSLFEVIYTKMYHLFKEREKEDRSKEKEEQWIDEVVTLLVHSNKARMCSHIRAVFHSKYKEIRPHYPSLAPLWKDEQKGNLEFHCTQFKKYFKEGDIRAVYHAFQIDLSEEKLKEKLFRSQKPVWFIFQQMMNPLEVYKSERILKFIEWYKDHIGGMNEGFMCWLVPLLYELGVIVEQPVEDIQGIPVTKNKDGEKLEIDEYVLDKHTSRGRGKGLVEFALYGSYVEPAAPFVNPLWKKFYEDGKRFEDGVPILGENSTREVPKKRVLRIAEMNATQATHESHAFEFIVRTQLTTMASKMDVYFARDSNKLVVVKGPYATRDSIDIMISNMEWKKMHGLPYTYFEVKELIPDLWPEGVPLGARNVIDRTRPAFFLVFDSYLTEDDLVIRTHQSKLWPPTDVINWDAVPFHFTHKDRPLTDQEYADYVHAILFRYLLGVSDLADRNFLMVNGRVISIDEEEMGKEIPIYATLKKNRAAFVYDWLKDHYEQLQVSSWKYDAQINKLRQIQNKQECLGLFQP
uniref:Uncharacterized protein n=1 Tax=viral metagenome TaxID=1070528 RepID=A0A6C0KUK7_9ZZZZ